MVCIKVKIIIRQWMWMKKVTASLWRQGTRAACPEWQPWLVWSSEQQCQTRRKLLRNKISNLINQTLLMGSNNLCLNTLSKEDGCKVKFGPCSLSCSEEKKNQSFVREERPTVREWKSLAYGLRHNSYEERTEVSDCSGRSGNELRKRGNRVPTLC